MIELKDVSIYSGLYDLKRCECFKDINVYDFIEQNDITDLEKLELMRIEAFEEYKEKGIKSILLNRELLQLIQSYKNLIEKDNQRGYEKKVYQIDEGPFLYNHNYNQDLVDKNVYGKDLLFQTPLHYSSTKRQIEEYSIYMLKQYLTHCTCYGRNELERRCRNYGDKTTSALAQSINFYNKQIERQAQYYNPNIHNESDIFYLNQEEKRILVEDQIREITDYLVDIAQQCIWGEMNETNKKDFIALAHKNTRLGLEYREKFVNAIGNYVTLDEAKQGLIKTKTIDRFILK